jgi:hypothetical protein
MLTDQHIEEALSRAYVQAIASRAGINIGSSQLDYGVDGTFTTIQIVNGRRVETGFHIDYQLKASTKWKLDENYIVYDLEAKTYNDLINRAGKKRVSPLVLILLCLPESIEQWLENDEEQLRLRRCCYWTMLSGSPTKNKYKVRVRIPRMQLLTPKTLRELFELIERGELQ